LSLTNSGFDWLFSFRLGLRALAKYQPVTFHLNPTLAQLLHQYTGAPISAPSSASGAGVSGPPPSAQLAAPVLAHIELTRIPGRTGYSSLPHG